MFGSYKNHDAINVSFKRLSELFRTSGKKGVKKGKNRIDLTDPSFVLLFIVVSMGSCCGYFLKIHFS